MKTWFSPFTFLTVLSLIFVTTTHCNAEEGLSRTTCRNRIRSARAALREAQKALNKGQRNFEKNENGCASATDKLEDLLARADAKEAQIKALLEQKCLLATEKLDTFVAKSEEKKAQITMKLQAKCDMEGLRIQSFIGDAEAKRADLVAKLNLLRKDEENAKECFGLIAIGDLCAGNDLERIRNRRRQAENKIRIFDMRTEGKLRTMTAKKDKACDIAAQPPQLNPEARVMMLTRRKENACALAADPVEQPYVERINSVTRKRDRVCSKRDAFAEQLPGLQAILDNKQDAYDEIQQLCENII